MTAVLYTPHFVQFFDSNGDPLAGGKLYTYAAGTTTPKATYADAAAAEENANPVVLDSAGRAKLFIDGSYRFVLHDSDDVAISNGTTDNITSFSNDIASGEPGDGTVTTIKIVDEAVTPAKLSAGFYGLFKNKVLSGLTLTNSTVDATNDIDITAGACVSDDGTTLMTLSTAVTKRLDAAWAVGTGQGGLDTGSASNTSYYVWVIYRADTDVTDVLFSASATSPTMPTNYTKKKLIGAFVRAGGAILPGVSNSALPVAIVSGDVQTLSGASLAVAGLSSRVINPIKRLTLTIAGMSTNGTDDIYFRIGPSGGVATSGYIGAFENVLVSAVNFSSSFLLSSVTAATTFHGRLVYDLLDASTNQWVMNMHLQRSESTSTTVFLGAGNVSLSGALDQFSISFSGSNNFDAGKVSWLIES